MNNVLFFNRFSLEDAWRWIVLIDWIRLMLSKKPKVFLAHKTLKRLSQFQLMSHKENWRVYVANPIIKIQKKVENL
ncbi:hypothetical protein PtA15_2A513 [Puccinia triticina]|uniref:Reverse transcriptase RNase H-like domain-containing protein n=1 Tax=Puccinia triticina TaxID=208348 RepID=A0ABY7CDI2_9BASI|nr:uncharacterized protein PtA15_2A513 [Puccinia triticina]WAQ82196.1 hypothetical protein PtA15_2A513 [Puccinia triticina]